MGLLFTVSLAMGLMIVGFGILINIVARKPWIITIPALVLVTIGALYMFLSNFFVWSLAFQDNYLNVSGGSDPHFEEVYG